MEQPFLRYVLKSLIVFGHILFQQHLAVKMFYERYGLISAISSSFR